MNPQPTNKKINIPKVASVFVIGAVCVCLFCLVGLFWGLWFITQNGVGDLSPKPFDSKIWKQCPKSSDGELDRQMMVKDLISRYKLTGMTEKELLELLGTDDGYVKTKHSTDQPGDWQHTYRLGSPSYNPMDLGVKVLLIKIKNGRVSEYKIERYYD